MGKINMKGGICDMSQENGKKDTVMKLTELHKYFLFLASFKN
jgi:hypothetical protein